MAPGNARGNHPLDESPGRALSRDVKTDPLQNFGESRPQPGMEDLEVTKTISLEEGVSLPNQAEVRTPAGGNAPSPFRERADQSAVLCLILCIALNLWINSERTRALIAQSSASLVGPRIASGRHQNRPGPNGLLGGGGNGIFQNLGVVLFVSGLSPYLQDSPQRPGLPNQCVSLRESGEGKQSGEQRRFPLYLQILASVLLCGLISWGDAVWIGKR